MFVKYKNNTKLQCQLKCHFKNVPVLQERQQKIVQNPSMRQDVDKIVLKLLIVYHRQQHYTKSLPGMDT